MKHCEPGRDATYQRDAPHTGARLETVTTIKEIEAGRMPPTRGHDLKHGIQQLLQLSDMMPPTRGHDLKLRRWPERAVYL